MARHSRAAWAFAAMAAAVATVAASGGCEKKPKAAAAAPAPASAGPNAADTYQSVWAALGQPLHDAIRDGQPADAMLARHAADIERLVEATRSERCDFGIDYAGGLDVKLPHLSTVRALARVLKADAVRLLALRDHDAAARRAAALLRLAAQVAEPAHSAIELLTACAVAGLGATLVSENPTLPQAASKADLQDALAAVARGGTLNSAAIVRHEGDLAARTIREGVDLSAMGGWNWGAESKAYRDAAADRLLAIYADAVSVWEAPDAPARLTALVQRSMQEGVGDLIAALDKIRNSVTETKAACDRASAALGR